MDEDARAELDDPLERAEESREEVAGKPSVVEVTVYLEENLLGLVS